MLRNRALKKVRVADPYREVPGGGPDRGHE